MSQIRISLKSTICTQSWSQTILTLPKRRPSSSWIWRGKMLSTHSLVLMSLKKRGRHLREISKGHKKLFSRRERNKKRRKGKMLKKRKLDKAETVKSTRTHWEIPMVILWLLSALWEDMVLRGSTLRRSSRSIRMYSLFCNPRLHSRWCNKSWKPSKWLSKTWLAAQSTFLTATYRHMSSRICMSIVDFSKQFS